MAANHIKVKMTPSHPGDFIRTEVIEELGLNVTKAAEILGVRRATLSDLLNCNAALSPEMALGIGLRSVHPDISARPAAARLFFRNGDG